jgi:hypothetical protein
MIFFKDDEEDFGSGKFAKYQNMIFFRTMKKILEVVNLPNIKKLSFLGQ